MKKYKLFIRKYNMMKNDYEIVEKIVETNDIYHEIGYIYCTTLEKIKRIDYIEIRDSIEIQKIQEAFESIEKYGYTNALFVEIIKVHFIQKMM